MSDLISRSALIEKINMIEINYPSDDKEDIIEKVLANIDLQPTVEPKRGEWLKTFRYMRENINTGKLEPVYSYDCPICKYHTGNQGGKFNFCPNCGADMRKKVQNELGR